MVKISLAKGYTRGDYKELVELSLAYMKSQLEKFKIRKPGAMHKARWMSRLLYSLKIVLLSNKLKVLNRTVFSASKIEKLKTLY